jgi:glutamyl-tRNA synthetase
MLTDADFSSQGLERLVKDYTEKHSIGFGKVATPLRLLIVGSGTGPHLFDILDMIGKDETIKRIDQGIEAMTI